MSESKQGADKGATQHQSTVTGVSQGETAQTEHRDTADGNAEQRNELSPRGGGQGPTTHDSLKTVRKGE